jgi:hypothetical protein
MGILPVMALRAKGAGGATIEVWLSCDPLSARPALSAELPMLRGW